MKWLRPMLLALPLPMMAGVGGMAPLRAKAAPARPVSAPAVAAQSARLRRLASDPAALAPERPPLSHVAQRLAHGGPLRIVAFGSSSTEGVGASTPAAAYPARLQAELASALPGTHATVVNQGIGGEDAEDLARRLPGILAQHPDLVIFQTGTNDPLRGVPLDRFEALTRAELVALRQAGIDVMLMEPQLCHVTLATPSAMLFRDVVRRIGLDMNVPVVRRWDLMQSWLDHHMVTRAQLLAADGLHMADEGYALLAREVLREILVNAGAKPGLTAS